MKIVISGDLGSGKSTICKLISNKYHIKFFSTGQIQRQIAKDLNMTTTDLNKYMENHFEIDERIDKEIVEIGKKYQDFVIDSRMAWHFIPDAFKVYLTVDNKIAAMRIMNDNRLSEKYSNIELALEQLKERRKSELYRYKNLYNIDLDNYNNYNLVLDTSRISQEEVLDIIYKYYNKWLENNDLHEVIMSGDN